MADVTVDLECKDSKELYGQGVRAFVLQDYESAVAALSKTSELLAIEHKDDLHDSLAEVYLYYGKALLGLSREQNEALGDAVPKNSAEDSEEDEEADEGIESEESEKNKTEDNSSASSVNGEGSKTAETKAEDAQPDDTKEEVTESSKPGSSGENGEPGPSSSKAEEEEDATDETGEDDATDLQLAWEVLELAKKIFKRLDDKKNLADTMIILGEVSLESENFESAINDMKQGLDLQKELYAKDSRTVAETLYKLGMAYSMNSQIDEAIDSFNSSLEYLRNRIKTLEEIKAMAQEHKDEVEEIKSLIPDIEDKIADMKVYKEEAIKKLAQAFKEPPKPTQDGAGSSKQVTNISHLVKRKRKADEAEEKADEAPAKKPAV